MRRTSIAPALLAAVTLQLGPPRRVTNFQDAYPMLSPDGSRVLSVEPDRRLGDLHDAPRRDRPRSADEQLPKERHKLFERQVGRFEELCERGSLNRLVSDDCDFQETRSGSALHPDVATSLPH